MIPFKNNIDRSLKKQDRMRMGELAMVTDNHFYQRTVAYILPVHRQTNEDGEFTGRVYLNIFCMGKTGIRTKGSGKLSYKNLYDGLLYQSGQNWIDLFTITQDRYITPFKTIPKHRGGLDQYYTVPFHNPWIHYNSIPEEKMPLYLGLNVSLDAEIAFRLNT